MSSEPSNPTLPGSGRLDQTPLPRLLLDLQRARVTGSLVLRHARIEKRVQLRQGAPVLVESNRSDEGLMCLLEKQGRIRPEQREAAAQLMRTRQCKELAALVGLKVLGPKDLFLALRDQARRCLIDCFAWNGGEFELKLEEPPAEESQPLQIDLLGLAQDGITAHWRPDQALSGLEDRLGMYPRPAPPFAQARSSLTEDETLRDLLDSLDGSLTTWNAIQRSGTPSAIAAFWVLDAVGALAYSAEAAEGEAEAPEGEAGPGLDIEIVVSGADGAATQAGAERPAERAADRASSADPGDSKLGDLREEVLRKHHQLRQLNLYELLGVKRDATPAQVKRAYIQAAKRLHPDSLSHLGLDDIKQQANEVFAEIAKAQTTLLDLEQRRSYDASLDGHTAVDANQVAQAEALFRKGEILLRAGNFLGALDFLKAAVRLWPEESDYQSAYGWALHRKNPPESESAREHLEKAVALDDENGEAYRRLGLVLKELGDSEAAKAALARARELSAAEK